MALPTSTGGSGLSRSEAAILAWKKRARAHPKPGALDPKIAARVKEILAAKQKKGKAKAGPKGKAKGAGKKVDPAKAKEKADRDKEKAAAKVEREKNKAERLTERAASKQEREKNKAERATAKVERVAAQAKKQQTTLAKQKDAARAQKEKAKAGANAKKDKEAAQAAAAKEKAAKPAKEQAANRAKVAKDMAGTDSGLSPRGSAALNDFADGKPLDKAVADDFEAMGLTEKDENGNHRLTTEGRAAASAMNKGDTRAAVDAISRAGSKKKSKSAGEKAKADATAKKDKAKADADKTKADATAKRDASAARLEAARIEAAQNRKAIDMDEYTLDDLLAIKAGARHSRTDLQHLQGIHDSSVACGASCGSESDDSPEDDTEDTAELEEAGKAIKGIMDNPQWYAQHECQDISQASVALNTLTMLIGSELSEDDEDDAHVAMLCDAARTLVKFISSELDELEGAAGDAADSARMGPMNKAVDDYLHIDGGAIKATGDDTIRGYAVLFGDAEHADLQKDYFTKSTDFWLDHWGWPKPITYHHGMDAATRDDPVVGHWKAAGVDDVGVWMEGQIDKAHAYYKAMKELAARGYLRLSSDSAPQWVIRERQSNGVNSIKRWPLVTSSVTVTPMEPRMLPVEVKAYLAEIGYDAIDSNPEAINPELAKADGQKASDDERTRRLLLELELLQLMETA